MTQAHLIRDLSEWAVWFAFTASLLFVPVTSLFWPWWRSSWGWNIVTLEAGVALALLPPWLRFTFGLNGSSYVFAWTDIAAIFIVGAIIAWRAVLIWITQRQGGRE